MSVTMVVISVTLFGLLIYDTWAMMRKGYHWTISYNLRDLANRFPVVALGIGIVLGHLFWSHPGDCTDESKSSKVIENPTDE